MAKSVTLVPPSNVGSGQSAARVGSPESDLATGATAHPLKVDILSETAKFQHPFLDKMSTLRCLAVKFPFKRKFPLKMRRGFALIGQPVGSP